MVETLARRRSFTSPPLVLTTVFTIAGSGCPSNVVSGTYTEPFGFEPPFDLPFPLPLPPQTFTVCNGASLFNGQRSFAEPGNPIIGPGFPVTYSYSVDGVIMSSTEKGAGLVIQSGGATGTYSVQSTYNIVTGVQAVNYALAYINSNYP
jgi:hypothetical protein